MREEPLSFVDLNKSFTKKSDDPLRVNKDITAPIYIVNKLSGTLTTLTKNVSFFKCKSIVEYCTISIGYPFLIHFLVRNEDKNNNKLVNIKYRSFYSGNYELFLHKNDAITHAIDILKEKRNKIDEKINNLLLSQR